MWWLQPIYVHESIRPMHRKFRDRMSTSLFFALMPIEVVRGDFALCDILFIDFPTNQLVGRFHKDPRYFNSVQTAGHPVSPADEKYQTPVSLIRSHHWSILTITSRVWTRAFYVGGMCHQRAGRPFLAGPHYWVKFVQGLSSQFFRAYVLSGVIGAR